MNAQADTKYNYLGHGYRCEDWPRENGQRSTNDHICILPDGTKMDMDFSQWTDINRETFEKWVDLGCPSRSDISTSRIGPVTAEIVKTLHAEQEEKPK